MVGLKAVCADKTPRTELFRPIELIESVRAISAAIIEFVDPARS